jgi:hypothetical protein
MKPTRILTARLVIPFDVTSPSHPVSSPRPGSTRPGPLKSNSSADQLG